jgi:hypothetical protein
MSTERLHALQLAAAAGAFVEVTRWDATARQRQIMRPRFTRKAEIRARLPPFLSVRVDPLAAHSILREQMREFMAERAIDFTRAKFHEPRIQGDQIPPRKRHARRVAQSGVPADHRSFRERGCANVFQ